MVKIRLRPRKQRRSPIPRGEIIRDSSKLQQTEFDSDKIPFDVYQVAQNVIHKGANADTRPGVTSLATITDILSIGLFEDLNVNTLVASVKTATNVQKIVSVNRSTGATIDLVTGIASEKAMKFISLRGTLYAVNGETAIQGHDTTGNFTIVLPNSAIADNIISDGERLWVTTTDGTLLFSLLESGRVTSFTQSGTGLERAGVANSDITKFVALASSGRIVLAVGENKSELHQTLNFKTGGYTTFPADISTLQENGAFDNLGVTSSGAVIAVGGQFYLKPEDGVLYKITPGSPTPKEIRSNLQQMEDFDWSNAQLGYDQRTNLLYIAGIDQATTNDIIVTFNTQEVNFSTYTNNFPKQWVSDKDNVYYLQTFGDTIQDAYKPTAVTDNGIGFPCLLETADTYGGNASFFKVMREMFINIKTFEDLTLLAKVFVDQRINGDKPESFTETITIAESSEAFEDSTAGFGLGPWGGSAISQTAELSTEEYKITDPINIEFARASIQLSWTSTNKQSIRGVGLFVVPTNKKIRTITMNQ